MRDLPENTEIVWAWVRSELNGVDIASRKDAVPDDLVEGSSWQQGPAFLKLPEEKWPIDKDKDKDTLALMAKGGLKNMIITVRDSIPMVQTRYKVKTQQYFGAWELPLVLGTTDLGFLLCMDAHSLSHRAGDLALSITKRLHM